MDENPVIAAVEKFRSQGRPVVGLSFDSPSKPTAFYVVFEDGTESALMGLATYTREQRLQWMAAANAFLDAQQST